MGKAMLFLVVILVLGVVFILYKGSQVAVSTEANSTPAEAPSLPDLKVKERASAAGDALKEGAKKAAAAVSGEKEIKPAIYKFEREVVEVKVGGKTEFKVTRSEGDMKALQLELVPAPGSPLTVAGGTFKSGETSAVVTVEAPGNAQDAGLTVRAPGFTKVIPVRVTK